MVSRFVLSSLVVLLGIGALAIPVAAAAKGASAGHSGFAFRSGIHAHRVFFPHPRFRSQALRLHRLALRRDRFLSAPLWPDFNDIGPYYYYDPAFYAPGDEGATAAPAVDDGATRPLRPAMVYRPGCRTQTQTVPSESGGTRDVHITRCY